MTHNHEHNNNPSYPPQEELPICTEVSGNNDQGLEDTDATFTVAGQGREEGEEEVQLNDHTCWQVDPGQGRTMQDQPTNEEVSSSTGVGRAEVTDVASTLIGRTLQGSLFNLMQTGQHFRSSTANVQARGQGLTNMNNSHRRVEPFDGVGAQQRNWQRLNQLTVQAITIRDATEFTRSDV